MAKKKDEYKIINVKNKKAFYNYEIVDKYTAGMMLMGTEIKSIRLGKVSLGEAHCYFKEQELFVKNMNISQYELGTHYNHAPSRDRKLLLNKRELTRIKKRLEEKGLTVVPLRLYISDRGFAKLEIGVAKGKNVHDKRESMKEKDTKRRLKAEQY